MTLTDVPPGREDRPHVRRRITDELWAWLLDTRATCPQEVAAAYAQRLRRPRLLSGQGTLFLVAADHPARGALSSGADALAMADRRALLDRLVTALSHPGVDGVLGSPDIVEELLLLGALEGKVVIGSMNRGGLDGADWTMDDRFTGYDAASLHAQRLDGGKMLLRLDDADPATAGTLEACAHAVSQLAALGLVAMVEPLPYRRTDGTPVLREDAASLARAVTVASALGTTSAWTWLKLPACAEPEAVYAATTLPCVVLGGPATEDPAAARGDWERALRQPVVRGLVVGRSLLFPPDGDVWGAVDAAARLLTAGRE